MTFGVVHLVVLPVADVDITVIIIHRAKALEAAILQLSVIDLSARELQLARRRRYKFVCIFTLGLIAVVVAHRRAQVINHCSHLPADRAVATGAQALWWEYLRQIEQPVLGIRQKVTRRLFQLIGDFKCF